MKTKILLLTTMIILIYFTINVLANNITGQLDGHYFDTTISTQGTCTVEPGAVAVTEATSGITIGPGFHAKKGCRFYAIAGQNHDEDSDGLPDWFELLYFEFFDLWDGNGNADSDGLTNLQEYNAGTNPTNNDTDYDLMPDDYEVAYGLNPVWDDAGDDEDGDLYSNYVEYVVGTNPDGNGPNEVPIQGYYYKFDSKKRVKQAVYLPDTQIEFIIEYEYDEAGNTISRIVFYS